MSECRYARGDASYIPSPLSRGSTGTDFFCVRIALPICTARAAENIAVAPVRRSAAARGVFCLAKCFALQIILHDGAATLAAEFCLLPARIDERNSVACHAFIASGKAKPLLGSRFYRNTLARDTERLGETVTHSGGVRRYFRLLSEQGNIDNTYGIPRLTQQLCYL